LKLPALKHFRENQQMTQDQLSARAGITTKTVSKAENGASVHNVTAQAIARALGVAVEELQ
jgi:transcriptional regulator with XRE-family HTH domain